MNARRLQRLRGYQAGHLEQLLQHFEVPRPDGRGLGAHLDYCTGAGKTYVGLALASRTLLSEGSALADPGPGRYTHAIFAGPSDVIRKGFDTERVLAFSDFGGSYAPIAVRDDTDLEIYLSTPRPGFGLRTTHQMLTTRFENLRQRCKLDSRFAQQKLLFLDEAQHAARDNLIGDLPDFWMGAGGDLIWSTATPEDAVPPGTFTRSRTLPEQMAERFAPGQILSQVVAVEGGAESTDDEIAVPKASPAEVARAFIVAWKKDGKPKTIVRLKSADHDSNAAVLLAVARAVLAEGARPYVASPAHEAARNADARAKEIAILNARVLSALSAAGATFASGTLSDVMRHEASIRRYEDSAVDVIIGIHTIVEGVDWPPCSHVYLLGIPRKIETIVQVLGRATRPRLDWDRHPTGWDRHPTGREAFWSKFEGYPEPWQNRSKIVFLTATDEEGKIRDAQSRQMLGLCAYLTSLRQWSPLGAAFRALRQLEIDAGPETAEDARENVLRELASESERQAILAASHEAEDFFRTHVEVLSRRLTCREKVRLILLWAERGPGCLLAGLIPDPDTRREKVWEIVVRSIPLAAARLSDLFAEENGGDGIAPAMKRAMARLVQEFEHEAAEGLGPSPFEGDVRLSAEDIVRWGKRMTEMTAAGRANVALAADGTPRARGTHVTDPYSAVLSRHRGIPR